MNITLILQIILAVSLSVLILLQPRGTGLARGMGGSTASFTRRGLERVIFRVTFAVAAFFLLLSIISIL